MRSRALARTSPLWLLALLIVAAAFAACGGGDRQADVVAAVEELQTTLNAGDAGEAYDNFAAADCLAIAGRAQFVAGFETFPYQISALSVRDDMQIDGDSAYLIVTATFTFAGGDPEIATFFETFVKEEGRWKDGDCLQGGMGGNLDTTQTP